MLSATALSSPRVFKLTLMLYRVLTSVLATCYLCLITFIVRFGLLSDHFWGSLGWTIFLAALLYGHFAGRRWASYYSLYSLFLMLAFQPKLVLLVPETSEAFYDAFGSTLAYVQIIALVNVIATQSLFDFFRKVIVDGLKSGAIRWRGMFTSF